MTEAEFLDGYDLSVFERPAVAVDLVLVGLYNARLSALLIQRDHHPFEGYWALPGGFVHIGEALDTATQRVLHDKAGIADAPLEQLFTFGAVARDPRMRIITVAWLGLLSEQAFAAALATNARLLPATIEVPWQGEAGGEVRPLAPDGNIVPIAFDHAEILALAILRLRGKLDYSDIGFALLPEEFTLRALQDVHEAILGVRLNKPAFRRRMRDKGWLVATGVREEGTSYRPAELFRFKRSR